VIRWHLPRTTEVDHFSVLVPMKRAAVAFVLASSWAAVDGAWAPNEPGCNIVAFDRIDKDLHVRTLVVETERERFLVLTGETDVSKPCGPRWWFDHGPRGSVSCLGVASHDLAVARSESSCGPGACQADVANIGLGYVRTMLASAVFAPQSHTMSAICIELGCKSRIKRGHFAGTLLETAPEVPWTPRPIPSRVLVIGLGSSMMALWLRGQLPDTEIDVAEIVPGVVAAAPCFGLDTQSDKKLRLHIGGGRAFLERSRDGAYDVILVDAFDTDASVPACLRTREFFALARRKLARGGALSFNLIAQNMSMRVLRSLAVNFDVNQVWVGEAPGAEGIQNVITAFAPGRPSAARARAFHGKSVAATAPAKEWFGAAHYRPLRTSMYAQAEILEDSSECHSRDGTEVVQ